MVAGHWLRSVLLVLGAAVAADDNMVVNGDFAKGELAPWIVTFPESNETKYGANHKWTRVVRATDAKGYCLQFELNAGVAASEGVKAVTPLIAVAPDQAYEYGAEVLTTGSAVKLFVEAYREDADQKEKGNDQYAGFTRVYRAPIHAKVTAGKWQQVSRRFQPPKRYQPTHVLVKLYAYWPAGTVSFRNIFLRPVDGKE